MSRRVIQVAVVAALLGCLAMSIAWWQADFPTRQRVRIRALDWAHTLGLGLPARDRQHMQERSGLSDISNVSCRNCHGESTNALAWAQPRTRHPAPGWMVFSEDGGRLYLSLPDLDEVAELDLDARRILRRTLVPGGPSGLALDPNGHALWVACRRGDRVARIDLGTLSEQASASVGIEPVGIGCVATTNGTRLVVANLRSDDISILSTEPLAECVRLKGGREPYGVGCVAEGRLAYVTARLAEMPGPNRAPSSELTVIDVVAGRVVSRVVLESAHLSESAAVVPGRSWVLAPLVRVRNLVPITQVARGWVMSSGVALIGVDGESVVQLPTDEANQYYADPGGIAVDALGRRAYIVSAGSDVVSVVDLDRVSEWLERADGGVRHRAIHDLELSPDYVLSRIPTGRNPRQVALSPDGTRLVVAEHLDDALLIVDTRNLVPVGRIQLGDGGVEDPVRRGERVFTWAGRTFQGQFSCRSCHPDGHVDGLTYDFDGDGIGDNLLDNRSLQGLAGTWPFKWNGRNPSLKVQCGPRFAKVLMRTEPFDDQQLDDLTRYIESLPPARVRHVLDTESSAARERGRAIFFATRTPGGIEIPVERRCSTCHTPPLYTNRSRTAVGTRGPRDLTDVFDTPHLLGIGASAPYLHDGRARTLEELWTLYQTNDLHGVSSYMSKQQLNDLVEFLKTL